MNTVEVGSGVRIQYRDIGGGQPIVFIPGFTSTLETWNYQVRDLAHEYRCVCIDPRGHGGSDAPLSDYSFDELCQDLAEFIEKVGLDDVTLVGHSAGGALALIYVLDHDSARRVNRLVLAAPAGPSFVATETEPWGMDAATGHQVLDHLRVASPEVQEDFSRIFYHRDDVDATRRWLLGKWNEAPIWVAERFFQALLDLDLRSRLSDVSVPTLLCWGHHDQIRDPRWADYIQSRIPTCRLDWFDDSGHGLMIDESERLSNSIRAFITGTKVG
jgi:pimeloyl-ACP methyl ester carboxylesterase